MQRPATKSAGETASIMHWLRRLWPVLALLAGLGVFFALRLDRYVNFAALKEHREVLLALVHEHRVAMPVGFVVLYALCVAFSLPVAVVLTVTAGFLFGQLIGTLVVVTGATMGAIGVFLAARTALGDALKKRAGPWLSKMRDGFRENAFHYLLVLRLVPLSPFAVVNLVPAFLGMKLRDYALATFLGIIPGSFVFTAVGAGLGAVFDAGGEFTASGILTPQVIVALGGLACLVMVPVVYKKLKAARARRR